MIQKQLVAIAAFSVLLVSLSSSPIEGEAASSRGAECFEYGYDYSGYDIQQVPFVSSPSICMEECGASRGCAFWTYDTVARICYLKSAGAFTERRPSNKMVSGPRQCTFSPYCYEVGVDYYGYDIEKLEGRYIMTPMDCQRLCTGNPQCAFFSWKFSTHSCFLKSSSAFMNRREDPDVTSGPRVCSNGGIPAPPHPNDFPTAFDPSTAPPSCVEAGVEYRGHTLRTSKAKSAAACQALCQQVRDCHYWTWSGQSRSCALKSAEATNGRTENQTTLDKVSGGRDCIPVLPGCQYANVGIVGARLSSRAAASFDVCQIYCASYSGCTHFSHDLLNRECTLWSSFNAYSQGTSTQGLISGPAFCDAQETCFEQSDYVGHNIDENETGEIESPAACQALCRNHADCHYWTWLRSNKGCYLKDENAITGKSNDITSTGRFSGPKWCTVSSGCKTLNAVYTGSIYHQEEAIDYKVCSSNCKASPFCTAWTFHSDLGFCSLFSGSAALASMPVRGAVSGDRNCIEDKPEDDSCFEEGILYSLDDVAAVTDAQNTDECFAACQRHSDCNWWSLKSGEQCYLLKHTDQPSFVFDPNSTSGPKFCPSRLTFYGEGHTFNKAPLATAFTYTLNGCRNKCLMTPQCHYWVFHKGNSDANCSLFDKTAGQHKEEDSDSFYGELLPTSFVATGCAFKNPLGSVILKDLGGCPHECQLNPLCNAWQVATDGVQSDGQAYVKCTLFKSGDTPIKVRDGNTKCGTKILPDQMLVGKAFPSSISSPSVVPAASLEDCAKSCYSQSGCLAWQWRNLECSVSDKLSVFEDASDSVSGRTEAPSFKTLFLNMAYSNAPEQQTSASSASSLRLSSAFRKRYMTRNSSRSQGTSDDCHQACKNEPTCVVWTFKENSCSLFTNALRLVPDNSATSGTRSAPQLLWNIQFNKSIKGTANHILSSASSPPGGQASKAAARASETPIPQTPIECAIATKAMTCACWSFQEPTEGTGPVCKGYTRCSGETEDSEGTVSGVVKDVAGDVPGSQNNQVTETPTDKENEEENDDEAEKEEEEEEEEEQAPEETDS